MMTTGIPGLHEASEYFDKVWALYHAEPPAWWRRRVRMPMHVKPRRNRHFRVAAIRRELCGARRAIYDQCDATDLSLPSGQRSHASVGRIRRNCCLPETFDTVRPTNPR